MGGPNPYRNRDDRKWYFFDETYDIHGPYPDELTATKRLLQYVQWLETGKLPSRWTRFSDWVYRIFS